MLVFLGQLFRQTPLRGVGRPSLAVSLHPPSRTSSLSILLPNNNSTDPIISHAGTVTVSMKKAVLFGAAVPLLYRCEFLFRGRLSIVAFQYPWSCVSVKHGIIKNVLLFLGFNVVNLPLMSRPFRTFYN